MKDCDFIPAEYHDRRRLRAAMRLRVTCVGTMLVLMLFWFVAHRQRLASAEAMMQEADQQHQQVRIHAARQESLKRQWDHLRDRRRLIDELSQQTGLVLLFADLSRRLPDPVLLTRLDLDCARLSHFAIRDSDESDDAGKRTPSGRARQPVEDDDTLDITPRIRMTGIARSQVDVINFAAAVESSPLFDRVEMKIRKAVDWGGRRAELFDLTCTLAPLKRETP